MANDLGRSGMGVRWTSVTSPSSWGDSPNGIVATRCHRAGGSERSAVRTSLRILTSRPGLDGAAAGEGAPKEVAVPADEVVGDPVQAGRMARATTIRRPRSLTEPRALPHSTRGPGDRTWCTA